MNPPPLTTGRCSSGSSPTPASIVLSPNQAPADGLARQGGHGITTGSRQTPLRGAAYPVGVSRTQARGGMRLECRQCVVRDWSPLDREALVRAADNRAIWRNLTHMFPHPY